MQGSASALFAARIRSLRKDRSWTQEQAAEACGLDYKLYQFYELGIKDNPGLKTLEKIAGGFGVPLQELLKATSPTKPPRRRKRK
jgi:transcriptional regulator with XRE-family HTH domain